MKRNILLLFITASALFISSTMQAQVPISALPSATGDLRSAFLPVVTNSTTRKATPLQIAIFDSIHVTQGTTYDSMWVMKGGVRLYYKLIRSGTGGTSYTAGNGIRIDGSTIRLADSIGNPSGFANVTYLNNIGSYSFRGPGSLYLNGGFSANLTVIGTASVIGATLNRGIDFRINGPDSIFFRGDGTIGNDVYHHSSSTLGDYKLLAISPSGGLIRYTGSLGAGSGTVNAGSQYRLAIYPNAGSNSVVGQGNAITANRALISDANGLPVHATATAADINNIAGLTGNVQTQINTINTQLAAMKDVRIDSTSGYQPIAGINGSGELQFRSDSIGGADNKVSVNFTGDNLKRRWSIQLNEANVVLANLSGTLPTAKGGVPSGGTTGQVLQKNSNSNYDVSWVTPAGASSNTPVTLLTRTVSAKDTFNIDLSAWYLTYDVIRIEIYNTAPVTDGAIAQLRVSSDGTNYDAGASNYVWMNKLLSSTGFTGDAASNGTALVLSHTDGVDNAANVDFTSTLEIRNPDASTKHFISINSRYANNGGTHYSYVGAGARDAQQILRGIQFRFSTGNISKATIKVIGIQ